MVTVSFSIFVKVVDKREREREREREMSLACEIGGLLWARRRFV